GTPEGPVEVRDVIEASLQRYASDRISGCPQSLGGGSESTSDNELVRTDTSHLPEHADEMESAEVGDRRQILKTERCRITVLEMFHYAKNARDLAAATLPLPWSPPDTQRGGNQIEQRVLEGALAAGQLPNRTIKCGEFRARWDTRHPEREVIQAQCFAHFRHDSAVES